MKFYTTINEKKLGELFELGHMVQNHVEVSDEELKERLIYGDLDDECHETGIRKSISSKFFSFKEAEKFVIETLIANRSVIEKWLDNRDENKLVISKKFLNEIGYGYAKNTSFKTKYPMYICQVVLKLGYNCDEFSIVTAYPDINTATAKRIEEDKKIFFENRKKNKR